MSTPDDETPDDEGEAFEPDDWSEDSSLWGDEPIERPRAFTDDQDAEPDEQHERASPVHKDADDESAGPDEQFDAPSSSDGHAEPREALDEPDDPQAHVEARPGPIAVHSPPDRVITDVLSDRRDVATLSDEHLVDERASDDTDEPDEHPAFDTQVEIDGATTPASRRTTPGEPRPTTPPVEVQVATLLADPSKRIVGDLHWSADEDGAQGREFLAPVRCAAGELRVRGQRCAAAGSLRFSLLSRGLGRIAALDLGHPHQSADGRLGGETHFHRRDAPGEQPTLPSLDPDDIAGAWRLFCALTNITHEGGLGDPPPVQETLL